MEKVTLLVMLFDVLLGLGLLWLAWQLLESRDLFKAIVLFVAFGLLMALAWVRLDAPDVALAEAAIGAGLTGALLMAALAKLPSRDTSESLADEKGYWLLRLTLLLVAVGLGSVVLSLPESAPGLGAEIASNLASSGVNNPVTAVLLNFRGYDTLLELMVLLLALLGVWSLGRSAPTREKPAGQVLTTLVQFLTPLLILVAAYLLWAGADAPGGAFQAGAVLAAAMVLLLLAGWPLQHLLSGWALRLVLVAGPATFVALAGLTLLDVGLLAYPPQHAGKLIFILEVAATFSIAVTLAALFLGYRPRASNKESG
ncbi:MAG: DUF4040 domain-containing protein [Gammaproteobacteria bacterium]|nr:DUF4040 domain-containing protein [Gammaproteobacteria bacterium]MCF6229303.1 DUF4040 domain-containing protein [Gammaproteobacteria bacterium]